MAQKLPDPICMPLEIWSYPDLSPEGKMLWALAHCVRDDAGARFSRDEICTLLSIKIKKLTAVIGELINTGLLKTTLLDDVYVLTTLLPSEI